MFEGKRKRGGKEGGREVETKRDTENSEVYVLTLSLQNIFYSVTTQ